MRMPRWAKMTKSYLRFWPILSTPIVFEQRLQPREQTSASCICDDGPAPVERKPVAGRWPQGM